MPRRSSDAPQTLAKADLVDRRKGAYDNVVPPSPSPLKEHRTGPEQAQPGSAVMPEADPPDESVPEGLKRDRKGPYSPTRGRNTT